MLRDERLQTVVSDIDAAPDRERVSRKLGWRWQGRTAGRSATRHAACQGGGRVLCCRC